MPRVYVRKFDYDEAIRRKANGESVREIAQSYGVTPGAVWRAVTPGVIERQLEAGRRYRAGGICDDCGGPMSRHARALGSKRCRPCSIIVRTTSVRPDTLRCVKCRRWKPDEEFSRNKQEKARRGRHSYCTKCGTIARREYRHRNPEKEIAYQREYYRTRRSALLKKLASEEK